MLYDSRLLASSQNQLKKKKSLDTELALRSGWTVTKKHLNRCSRTTDIFIPRIPLSTQNLAPTFPTMQLNRQQFGWRFGTSLGAVYETSRKPFRFHKRLYTTDFTYSVVLCTQTEFDVNRLDV